MQGLGVCVLVPLSFLVPKKEAGYQLDDSRTAAVQHVAEAETSLGVIDTDVWLPVQEPRVFPQGETGLEQPLLGSNSKCNSHGVIYTGLV